MRRLVLLRHGQTPWNAEQRWQGQADVALDETGRLQAKRAASAIAELRPSRIVSSDLARAAETARIIAEVADVEPAYDSRLREIDVGRFSGMTKSEVAERWGGAVDAATRDFTEHGGESEEDVRHRLRHTLEATAAELGQDETALVVGHGAALRIGACDLLGWPAGAARTLGALSNCGWLELVGGLTGSHGGAPWRLTCYNRVTSIS